MRAVWKGTIGFGTYAIPVKAYTATEEHGTGLNQIHLADGGRIRNKRVCELDGAEVEAAEVGKGYALPGGSVVRLTEEDFARLPLPTAQSIDVCAFVPAEQIDPVYYARSYFLEPEVTGTKPYVLFSEALQQSGKVAVVKVALRQRETLATLRVRDQVLMLETMYWPDEVRTADFPFLHEDVDLRLPELREAVDLIEALAGDFEPGQYTDSYSAALDALIRAKVEGSELVQPTEPIQDEGVTELLAALQRSHEAVANAKAAAGKAARAKSTAKRAARKSRTAADSNH
ncbi:non-homologous end joining protein Ku [Amycolatopsis aidingensis]|uniref:non-homologous end joining protein Ku n=1 Tax=Amycolatopsis aidingensis TaxID=2842453 RepID=UPI001C0B7223|nr:Ku protein [Amycolatopsis aidingensis]